MFSGHLLVEFHSLCIVLQLYFVAYASKQHTFFFMPRVKSEIC